MTLNFNSLIIFVQNIDLLKSFYVDTLELRIIEEQQSKWLLLQAGYFTLGLHQIGVPYRNENEKPYRIDNNTKLVFEIDDDINRVREILLAKNVSVKSVITWDGYEYLLCDGEDPEGNIFQLKAKK